MKKMFVVLVIFISCGDEEVAPVPEDINMDSTLSGLNHRQDSLMDRIDSLIFYSSKCREFGKKRDSLEIEYLRHERESDRLLGNRYVDSGRHYNKLLQNLK